MEKRTGKERDIKLHWTEGGGRGKEVGPKQKEKKEGGGTEVMWAAERRRSNVKWRGEESDTLEERRRWQKGGQLSTCIQVLWSTREDPPYVRMYT